METTVKLHSLNYNTAKTYLYVALFVVGNILLPQLCHLIPNGGLILLPIYFFTLIAAYKYGIWAGLLTAILSPLANHLLFGMPSIEVLPIILIKSSLLAICAAYAAHRFQKISILILAGVVLVYQLAGAAIEWAIVRDFPTVVQGFRMAIPGMLLQIVGGYLVLKGIRKL